MVAICRSDRISSVLDGQRLLQTGYWCTHPLQVILDNDDYFKPMLRLNRLKPGDVIDAVRFANDGPGAAVVEEVSLRILEVTKDRIRFAPRGDIKVYGESDFVEAGKYQVKQQPAGTWDILTPDGETVETGFRTKPEAQQHARNLPSLKPVAPKEEYASNSNWRAEHKGRGVWAVFDGDREIVSGLDKDEAHAIARGDKAVPEAA